MNRQQREAIDLCCEHFVHEVDLIKLWPKLLENKVYNRDDVNIPRWTRDLTDEDTVRDVFLTIKTRGRLAFERLNTSLRQSDHGTLADILERKHVPNRHDRVRQSNVDESVPTFHITESEPFEFHENEKKERDDFFHTIQSSEKPLHIRVRKATKFLDGPAYNSVQRYPMRSKPRGLVMIVTNIHYKHLDRPRMSAIHDEENLTQLFDQMGFKIVTFRDLTNRELEEKVKEFSQREDLRKVDSCFVIISSHGSMGLENDETEILGVDFRSEENEARVTYKRLLCTDIMDYFKAESCPHLAGKPKIFIFQLCRGEKKQNMVREPRHTTDTFNFHSTRVENVNNLKKNTKKTMRNYADMLVAHATMPGHVAFRDNVTGSWFIQILCEVFMNYACTTHLQDLMNIVDERLGTQKTTNEECQTMTVTSIGFNRHCYLSPGLFEAA